MSEHELSAMKKILECERNEIANFSKELFGNNKMIKGLELFDEKYINDDNLAFIKKQLDNGMHPSYLEEGELKVLCDNLGEEWYLQWNYVKEDLNEIVTLKR